MSFFDGFPITFSAALAKGFWRAIGVYARDGDTIVVVWDRGMGETLELPIRLAGIDTPEIVGATHQMGMQAKAVTEPLILNRPLLFRLWVNKRDRPVQSFDRYVGDVLYWSEGDWHNLSELLLERGVAIPMKP
jgi:endonuclease YncB( thermonuclease family)